MEQIITFTVPELCPPFKAGAKLVISLRFLSQKGREKLNQTDLFSPLL